MSFRPLNTNNSLATNFNNVTDFMRNTDNAVDRLLQQFDGSGTAVTVTKVASNTNATASFPHGLKYIPGVICRIENNTSAPGEWHQGRYESVDTATGTMDTMVYMSADDTNIYLKAVTPSGGASYGSSLTFNSVYWLIGGR